MDKLQVAGDEAFKKGNLKRALKDYIYALKNDQNNISLLKKIATCECSLEKYEDLLTTTEKMLKIDKKSIEGYYFKAIGFLQTKRIKESKEILLLGLEIDPKNEKLNELLKQLNIELSIDPKKSLEIKEIGNSLFSQNKFSEAIEKYELSMKYNPKDFNLYHNKGFCLQKLGKIDLAIEFFKIAIELNPKLVKSFYKLGQCYYEKNQIVNCIDILRAALEIEVNQDLKTFFEKVISEYEKKASEHLDLGDQEMKKGLLVEGFHQYQKAYDIYKVTKNLKGERESLNKLGIIYNQNLEYEKALYHFELCLKLDKELDDKEGESLSHVNIGSVYFLMKKLDNSLKHYNSAYKIQKKMNQLDKTLLKNLAILHQQMNELENSIFYLEELSKIEKDEKILISIGTLYERINKNDKAKEYYNEALKIKENGKVYLNYGSILEQEKDYQGSISKFLKSKEIFEREKDENGLCLSNLNLGILHYKIGKKKESIEYYNESLKHTKDEKMKFGIEENIKKSEAL